METSLLFLYGYDIVEPSDGADSDSSFTPDPDKTYYIDCPKWDLRLAATGESEDAYTTSTSTTGDDVEWQFTDKANGYWHIDRAAVGSLPRLRTDNSEYADMNTTSSTGSYTYYDFPEGSSSGTYFITLPNGPTDHNRLQINTSGEVLMVPDSYDGSWESFTFTEVSTCATFSTIEAEDFDSMSGVVDEGENVGYIQDGDWAMYRDIDLTCAASIDVSASSRYDGGDIEVRLGSSTGELIATVTVASTGSWTSWETSSANLISSVSGDQDVYLVFTGGSGYLFNLDWIEFSSDLKSATVKSEPLDNNNVQLINIYPNPVTDMLYITSESEFSVNIYNTIGELIYSAANAEGELTFNMSALEDGVYLVQTIQNGNLSSQKLIKK